MTCFPFSYFPNNLASKFELRNLLFAKQGSLRVDLPEKVTKMLIKIQFIVKILLVGVLVRITYHIPNCSKSMSRYITQLFNHTRNCFLIASVIYEVLMASLENEFPIRKDVKGNISEVYENFRIKPSNTRTVARESNLPQDRNPYFEQVYGFVSYREMPDFENFGNQYELQAERNLFENYFQDLSQTSRLAQCL